MQGYCILFYIRHLDWIKILNLSVWIHSSNINTGFVNTDISLIESDGSNMKNIISRPGLDSNPIFSGDGNKFAFISSGGRQESIGLRDVYIYDLENQKTINPPCWKMKNITKNILGSICISYLHLVSSFIFSRFPTLKIFELFQTAYRSTRCPTKF